MTDIVSSPAWAAAHTRTAASHASNYVASSDDLRHAHASMSALGVAAEWQLLPGAVVDDALAQSFPQLALHVPHGGQSGAALSGSGSHHAVADGAAHAFYVRDLVGIPLPVLSGVRDAALGVLAEAVRILGAPLSVPASMLVGVLEMLRAR